MILESKFRSIFSNSRWRIRLVIWTAAISAGLVVVLFARLAEIGQKVFNTFLLPQKYYLLIAIPLAASLIVYLTQRFFNGAQGSGIPQVIAASKLELNGKPSSHLISLKIAIGKVFLGFVGVAFGFSIGREGPSVQVAASFLSSFNNFLPNNRVIKKSDLILAGGAAGIAAAFNTPLAGIVFAVEELGKRLESRTSGILLGTIIVSGFVAIGIMGNYKYFGHFIIADLDFLFLKYMVVAAILSGILGGIFSKLLLSPVKHSTFFIWAFKSKSPVIFAGICGFLVALIGLLSNGVSFGSGYGITQQITNQSVTNIGMVLVSKYLATVFSYFSGIPGGIFAPSLSIGSAVGGFIHQILGAPNQYLVPLIAICMVGFLSAVTQAPITSSIIVMEMIDGHEMLLALFTVALISKAISSRFSVPLYSGLSLPMIKDVLPSKR